jgi:hypothetical protein
MPFVKESVNMLNIAFLLSGLKVLRVIHTFENLADS